MLSKKITDRWKSKVVDIIEERSERLNDWEVSFIEHVDKCLDERELSFKESKKLNEIYIKVFK